MLLVADMSMQYGIYQKQMITVLGIAPLLIRDDLFSCLFSFYFLNLFLVWKDLLEVYVF